MTGTGGLTLLFVFIYLVGCAQKATYIDLVYPPESEIENDTITAVDTDSTVMASDAVLLDVQDDRANTIDVGRMYTGMFGESYSELLTDQNVETWVFDAIVAEFGALGIDVLHAAGSAKTTGADDIRVSIKLLQARCAWDCDGEVMLAAVLTRTGKDAVVGEFPVDLSSENWIWLKVQPTAEGVLGRALQMAVRQMLVEFEYASPNRE